MIQLHTPIKKWTLSQGTLDPLELRSPADMVRPVAVDHENPAGLRSLSRRRRGKNGLTKDKCAQRQEKESDRKKTIHEKIPARGRGGSIGLKKLLGRPMPIRDILPVSIIRSNEKYPAPNILRTGYFYIFVSECKQAGTGMGNADNAVDH